MALTDKLTAIANAIRGKTGGTATMTLDEMATTIAELGGGITSAVYLGSTTKSFSGNTFTVTKLPLLIFLTGTTYTMYSIYQLKNDKSGYKIILNKSGASNGITIINDTSIKVLPRKDDGEYYSLEVNVLYD